MPVFRPKIRQAQEIEAVLIERIPVWEEGGGRIPAETELAAEFGVSRVTIREALASLERRGLILRKHGLGTFVNSRATHIQTRLDESIEFGELIQAAGYEPGLGYLDSRVEAASASIAERLAIAEGEQVLSIYKVFEANGDPVIYLTNIIPLKLATANNLEEILDRSHLHRSVYSLLDRWFGQKVAYQISSVSATISGPEISARLRCPEESALLRMEDVGYNLEQQAVFYGDVYFLPGTFEFQLIRKPVYSVDKPPGLG